MINANTEELCLIYKQIKTEPDTWDQDVWAAKIFVATEEGEVEQHCGTAYCVAGWAVHRAGYQPNFGNGADASSCTHPETGEVMSIPSVARKVLGLSIEQSDNLFSPGNTLEDIRENIEHITGVDPEGVI